MKKVFCFLLMTLIFVEGTFMILTDQPSAVPNVSGEIYTTNNWPDPDEN